MPRWNGADIYRNLASLVCCSKNPIGDMSAQLSSSRKQVRFLWQKLLPESVCNPIPLIFGTNSSYHLGQPCVRNNGLWPQEKLPLSFHPHLDKPLRVILPGRKLFQVCDLSKLVVTSLSVSLGEDNTNTFRPQENFRLLTLPAVLCTYESAWDTLILFHHAYRQLRLRVSTNSQ